MAVTLLARLPALVFALVFTMSGRSSAQFMGPYTRTNLSLIVVVKYPEQQLTSHGLTTDLFLVGNGLGLSWDSPQKLNKVGRDMWQRDFLIKATPDGHSCQDCVNNETIPLGQKFEYRVNADGEYDMIGASYGIDLPLSKMSSYFVTPPVRYVYPHFFTFEGTTGSIDVASNDELIATRNWGFYLPSSFSENTYKRYPIALAFDLGSDVLPMLRAYIDDLTVKYALAEEAIFIGSGDYRPLPNRTWDGQGDRLYLLTPTVGTEFLCFEGDMYADGCNGCIPPNITDMHEKMILMRDKCGYPVPIGGKGDEYIDYWLQQVVPAVNNVTSERLLTDRYQTVVGGCSTGGLLACHALWTRPESFYSAACQSSSFWWPTTENADNGFDFLNVTLKSGTGPREPQRVYIDVTDLEDNPYYAQLSAALQVADVMVNSSPQFVWDKTVTLAVINDQVHGGFECLSRLWIYNNKLFPAEGGPRNPLSPVIQTRSFKAEEESLVSWGQTAIETSGDSKDWSKDFFSRLNNQPSDDEY